MAENKKATKVHCPRCGNESFVDTWKPPAGIDSCMRRFICSRGNHEFYLLIPNRERRKAYGRQLSR